MKKISQNQHIQFVQEVESFSVGYSLISLISSVPFRWFVCGYLVKGYLLQQDFFKNVFFVTIFHLTVN